MLFASEPDEVIPPQAELECYLCYLAAPCGWRGFYDAERVAYTTQYGVNPYPLTAFNATAQAYPVTTRVVVIGGTVYVTYEALND